MGFSDHLEYWRRVWQHANQETWQAISSGWGLFFGVNGLLSTGIAFLRANTDKRIEMSEHGLVAIAILVVSALVVWAWNFLAAPSRMEREIVKGRNEKFRELGVEKANLEARLEAITRSSPSFSARLGWHCVTLQPTWIPIKNKGEVEDPASVLEYGFVAEENRRRHELTWILCLIVENIADATKAEELRVRLTFRSATQFVVREPLWLDQTRQFVPVPVDRTPTSIAHEDEACIGLILCDLDARKDQSIEFEPYPAMFALARDSLGCVRWRKGIRELTLRDYQCEVAILHSSGSARLLIEPPEDNPLGLQVTPDNIQVRVYTDCPHALTA
jgi:hypothetical protein